MCDTTKNITIGNIHPKDSTGSDLRGCYFQWVKEVNGINFYDFYFDSEERHMKVAGLCVGDVFNFELPYPEFTNIVWVLNIIGASRTSVTGNWSAVPKPLPPDCVVVPEQDQSYQAQAGGTLPYETTVAVAVTAQQSM